MNEYMPKVIKIVDLNQNLPLSQIIYQGLRTAIISGVIPMGERINEKQYADSLNVSRTPIRDAVHRMRDEGLVEYIPNLGNVVKTFTVKDVEEIYQIRIALDILASTNAMKLLTPAKEKYMESLLKETALAQKKGDVKRVIEMSKLFNNTIYEFAEMPRLESIQTKLRDYIIRFRDISLTAYERREHAIYEHELIFRCMKNGNVEQMEMVINEHLQKSKKFILLEMSRQSNE